MQRQKNLSQIEKIAFNVLDSKEFEKLKSFVEYAQKKPILFRK